MLPNPGNFLFNSECLIHFRYFRRLYMFENVMRSVLLFLNSRTKLLPLHLMVPEQRWTKMTPGQPVTSCICVPHAHEGLRGYERMSMLCVGDTPKMMWKEWRNRINLLSLKRGIAASFCMSRCFLKVVRIKLRRSPLFFTAIAHCLSSYWYNSYLAIADVVAKPCSLTRVRD